MTDVSLGAVLTSYLAVEAQPFKFSFALDDNGLSSISTFRHNVSWGAIRAAIVQYTLDPDVRVVATSTHKVGQDRFKLKRSKHTAI